MKEYKKILRKEVARKKKSFCATALLELSKDTLKLLENHPKFREAETILLYYSLPDEVDTHDFIEKWYKKKRIILPVVIGDELELRKYEGKDSLNMGAYNILEPNTEIFREYQLIDLAVVPGVAFDKEGCRLGRGKGYYDRLLPLINCYKIGICFPFQLYDSIPTEKFDIKMDEVIVEPIT